jgi:hypothetical protein
MEKVIIGLTEDVVINDHVLKAKIDTGAKGSSVSEELVQELGLKQIKGKILVRSASGQQVRPLVEGYLKLKGKDMKVRFNVTDRSMMTYKVLIGVEVLRKGFLVDPSME